MPMRPWQARGGQVSGSCRRGSRGRAAHACQEGGKALAEALKKVLRKVEKLKRGPFTVIEHHGNGTVAMQKSPCAPGSASARRL